jgi:hypothetical protein
MNTRQFYALRAHATEDLTSSTCDVSGSLIIHGDDIFVMYFIHTAVFTMSTALSSQKSGPSKVF